MTPKTAEDGRVAAALRGGTIPPEFLLGYGVVFTVPDTPVPGPKLYRLWGMEGLDPDLIPQNRSPVNAFKNACRSVEQRRAAPNVDGTGTPLAAQTEVKVDMVGDLPHSCSYQITHLIRDTDLRVIDHEKSMRVTYLKDSGEIFVEPLDPEHYKLLSGLEQAIRDHFDENVEKVQGSKIRGAIRAYLKQLGGTNARGGSGGFYFVPTDGLDTLQSIRTVLSNLYDDESVASLITLPIVDGDYERTLIEQRFKVNAATEINELLAEVSNYLRKGTIRQMKLDNLIKARSGLSQSLSRYRELLNSELGEVAEKLALLDEGLEKVMEAKYVAD
jgi:hypothetical protein